MRGMPYARSLVLVVLALILFALSSCEKTEGQGSGGLDPGSSQPDITEGYICSDVFDGKPRGIDNSFFADETVYLWLSWVKVPDKHEVKVIWVDPGDDVVETSRQTFTSESGNQITYFFLDTSSSAPVGKWIAEIYLDERFIRSYSFWILER
jgi:hypothetical protein